MIDFEKLGLQTTVDSLRERISELEKENLRLQSLLRITEMERPTVAPPERVLPLEGQVVAEAEFAPAEDYLGMPDRKLFESLEEAGDRASVMTSLVAGSRDGMHKIVLDVDMPVVVLPSSTPGHHHLIIDKMLGYTEYFELVRALVRAGVVEPGYKDASIARGYTAVRLPWVKKGAGA